MRVLEIENVMGTYWVHFKQYPFLFLLAGYGAYNSVLRSMRDRVLISKSMENNIASRTTFMNKQIIRAATTTLPLVNNSNLSTYKMQNRKDRRRLSLNLVRVRLITLCM